MTSKECECFSKFNADLYIFCIYEKYPVFYIGPFFKHKSAMFDQKTCYPQNWYVLNKVRYVLKWVVCWTRIEGKVATKIISIVYEINPFIWKRGILSFPYPGVLCSSSFVFIRKKLICSNHKIVYYR